jgi:hypothetical protein
MRHELLNSARRIAGELRTSEDEYDVAMATNARLVASLLDARREAGLPAATGSDALDHALQAIACAAEARGKLIAAHDALAKLDLRELATGDLSECPPKTASLTLVAEPGRDAA